MAGAARYIDALTRAVSPLKSTFDFGNVLSSLAAHTASASGPPLDHFYARVGAFNGPFFPQGWGNLSVVNFEEDLRLLIAGPPSTIRLSWRLLERGNRDGVDYLLYEGSFRTPCLQRVFDALPPESRTGRVQLLMPAHLQPFRAPPVDEAPPLSPASAALVQQRDEQRAQEQHDRDRGPHGAFSEPQRSGLVSAVGAAGSGPEGPACAIHLAATGDQTFGRRVRLGFPLLKDNICSLVLESPFYGARKPEAQRGSKLLRVSDLLTLGWATIAESVNLLHWLREEGYGPLGMTGLSMGGVHACMTAGLFPGDVAVTPLLAPRSAAVAYCDGAMRAVMAWEPLLKEVDEANNDVHQMVLSAGRAITVELPPGASASGGGGGGGVALMREATYALADLELRGEERHTEAEAQAQAAAGGAGGGAAGGGGSGGGGGVGISEIVSGLRLPLVSIMDLYDSMAGAALRAGSRATGAGAQPHGAEAPAKAQAPPAVAEAEAGGPFSGLIDDCQGQDTVSGKASSAGSNGGRPQGGGGRDAGAVRRHHSAQGPHGPSHATEPRPQPAPHGPDMPFPPYTPGNNTATPQTTSASPPASPPGSSGPASSGLNAAGGGGGGGTVLGRRLLGDLGRAVRQLRDTDRRMDNPETVARLKRVLETYTDVTRYPKPRRTDAAVIVAARDDAYVSRESVDQLHSYYSGSELRMVSGGHVSAFLMHQDAFRSAIRDSMVRVARPPAQQGGAGAGPPPGRGAGRQ
ncbi:hypothetical protein HYH03_002611 [Edaphochlamys debaryana]|uniref:Uncharacterized protein n=1 Tax=Edaphochlamys debaryana TaxID=47281 RepID=A0A836C410_9CHLO|nr:hypothetical protein HYH03_002611 [Edaphochlamys debaryana]|eukprot:KAG2499676.1 hypothetical protein HYH03_002611 [Edaphochlamys debaryana]